MKHLRKFNEMETYPPFPGNFKKSEERDLITPPFDEKDENIGRKYRLAIRNNIPLEKIKEIIDELPSNYFSRPFYSTSKAFLGNDNPAAQSAADYERKDVLQYLFDSDLLKKEQLPLIKKWISKSTNLRNSGKIQDMNDFIDSLIEE